MNKKKYIEPEIKVVVMRHHLLQAISPQERTIDKKEEEVSSFDDLL